VRGFEAALRRDYLVRQAESGYAQSAIVTASDVDLLLRLEAQQREAAHAVLRPARVRDKVKVTAEAIEQEYQAHADRYRTPERVRIESLRLSADELAKGIRLSEDEIRQAMADATHAAGAQEQRRASHILVKLPDKADTAAEKAAMGRIQSLRARLLAGGDFAALAKAHSEDPGSAAKGGDLGVVGRGVFAKEFEQALYALKKPGELSGPVRTPYGLHLIKLTGIQGASAGVSRAKVETELRARKAEERFVELSERLHNLVYEQSDSLKPAAETLGLKIEASGWFTRGGSPGGLTAERKVIDAAFDPEVLEHGRNSPAIEIGRDTLVALRVVEREPARQRPLAEVRGEIEKQLLARAQQAEVERLAQAAVQDMAGGKGLEAVARQYGMDVQAVRRFARKQAGVDAQLVDALFKAAHPSDNKPVHGKAALADGSYAVFELKRVIEPESIKPDAAQVTAVRRALEARRGREYYDNYRAGLRQQAKVKVYKDQL
jgi:peptidyl-prolyl cis-trans isomerase D